MKDCIFCRIIEGSIPSTRIFENESVIAFKDLSPHANEHYLFIHRDHTKDVNDMMETSPDQIKDIFSAIKDYTRESGLEKEGFRVVTNLGSHGGQTVFHTHFHLIGGEPLGRFGR